MELKKQLMKKGDTTKQERRGQREREKERVDER